MSDTSLASFSNTMMRCMPRLVRGMMVQQRDALGSGQITIPQYLLLDLLDTHERLKMNEIARMLNVSLPSTTGVVNRLFVLGMVRRTYDERDRRVIYIELTPQGKRFLEQVRRARKRTVEKVFSQLSEAERDRYLGIVTKLIHILYPEEDES